MDIEWTDFLLELEESDFTIPDNDCLHTSPTNKLPDYELNGCPNLNLLEGLDAALNKPIRPRNRWTPEDNELLMKIHAENEDKGWSFIATSFPVHTEKQVKRKYLDLLRKLKSKTSVDKGKVRAKKLKIVSVVDKLKFIENVKERVKTLENAIHDSSSKIREIMKKYSKQ